MNPLLTSALILGIASFVLFFAWIKSAPKITADALLLRAQKWDVVNPETPPGVIYQKVKIKAPGSTFERAIYRDAQGKRRPKQQHVSPGDALLRQRLSMAGVNWDEPLSAAMYKDWHDHQRIRGDAVLRTGKNLLTLTSTAAPGSLVAQETLTVRESDFHPVDRTVELRDVGTIEIAELNYDVMPWGAMNDGWFEPAVLPVDAPSHIHSSPLIHLPARPSESELDLAELSARVTLNRLHADDGERIDVVRSAGVIQVKGIVETDERKHELESQLRLLPHVVSSIFSYRDMELQPGAASNISSIRESSVISRPTPLESYLTDRGWSRDRIREVSYQIFDSSTRLYRESAAIGDLVKEFSSKNQLPAEARVAFEQLVSSHKVKLYSALEAEEHEIKEAGLAKPPPSDFENLDNLVSAARHNLDLVKELVSASDLQSRTAESITPELITSIAQLQARVAHLPEDPHTSQNPPSGRQALSEPR
jgi:hypothetical protein